MSIADHWDSGSYLPEGVHRVRITDVENYRSTQKGTPGAKLTVEDELGRTLSHTLWLTEKAMGIVASWFAACGFTRDQCATFDETDFKTYLRLRNKTLLVHVAKEDGNDGKRYNRVVDWEAVPTDPRVTEAAAPEYVAPADDDDTVPF